MDKYHLLKDGHREVFAHSPIADAQGHSSHQSFPPRASRQSAPVIRLFRSPSRDIFTPPSTHDFGCTETEKTDPLPSLAHCCPRQHKGEFGQCKRVSPSTAFFIADALDKADAFGAIHHHLLHVPALWSVNASDIASQTGRRGAGPAVV